MDDRMDRPCVDQLANPHEFIPVRFHEDRCGSYVVPRGQVFGSITRDRDEYSVPPQHPSRAVQYLPTYRVEDHVHALHSALMDGGVVQASSFR